MSARSIDSDAAALIHIGLAVRQRRLSLGMSQETLADKATLHRTYVGGVERGERNISVLNLLRLAEALNVPASRLLEDAPRVGSQEPR